MDGRSRPCGDWPIPGSVGDLKDFMQENNLVNEPQEVYNLRGDVSKIAFVKNFKEVQRLKIQLDQYTDLDEGQRGEIETILPTEKLQEFRISYIEKARELGKTQYDKEDGTSGDVQQLDFEFVLFASDVIDYDYIMNLVAESTQQKTSKQKMTKKEIINLLKSNAGLIGEEEDLEDYIGQVDWGVGQTADELKKNYEIFKAKKYDRALESIAGDHGLQTADLGTFVKDIMGRMIFDGEKLTDLMEPLGLGWKERSKAETALMGDLAPHLKKLARGQEISGLAAYDPRT